MDTLINQTLESICAFGSDGIQIFRLFQALTQSDPVKKSIFNRLVSLPILYFVDKDHLIDAKNLKYDFLYEPENLGVKVVADEAFRNSFLGFDDLSAANWKIPGDQKRTLERIAVSGTNGITQCDLAKEFGIKGNNFFYQVRNLECQQLIVRQSTIIREKQVGNDVDKEHKNSSILNTNLLHLYRYSKSVNLYAQQRVEISKPTWLDMSENTGNANNSSSIGDEPNVEYVKEDMLVMNFLPEMKAISDTLEKANGKVLVVSDIKKMLDYTKSRGHRAWRNIARRLENAKLVEMFNANVNGKEVQCIRLLKKFDPSDFQSKRANTKYDGCDNDNFAKHVKRGHVTDQFLELPMEHRIYDMVDAEGPKGITLLEVCKRHGLNSKKMYKRINGMCTRFGMCMESEKPNRTVLYRIWTHKNYNLYSANVSSGNFQENPNGAALIAKSSDLIPCEKYYPDEDINSNKRKNPDEDLELTDEFSVGINDAELVTSTKDSSILSSECPSSVSPAKTKRSQWYRHVSSTGLGLRREQLIIERLEKDKFILHGKLYKWLKDMEKDDKPTTLDRKTLKRTLKTLQENKQCKISQVSIPAVTNLYQIREQDVILHPSVDSKDLMDQIYKSYRDFEFQCRSHESTKSANEPLPVLTNIERSSNQTDENQLVLDAMRANGFVQAKMVRAKLFHQFLWCYISSLPDWNKIDWKNFEFSMKASIEAMPLELFLQIVGVATEISDMVHKCKLGLRLMDLSAVEKRSLLDTNATARLSRIIDILIRLKLIHLACQEPKGVDQQPYATPKHTMEFKPYIEEPIPKVPSSLKINSLDLRPRIRHDFIFSKKEDVDAYWQTLEYCFANADPDSAKLSFPGSAANEVFNFRSWTSIRVMTAVQRIELLRRMEIDDIEKKIPFKECVKIARELNLSVDQVLRVSYDKQYRRSQRIYKTKKSKEQQKSLDTNCGHTNKRRRSSKDRIDKQTNDPETTDTSCNPKLPAIPCADEKDMDIDFSMRSDIEMQDDIMEACMDNVHDNSAVESDPHEDDELSLSFLKNRVFSSPYTGRRRRFTWTDELDRRLVTEYARECVMLGDRFNRVNWSSMKNLPTDSIACGRRMNKLKSDDSTRRTIMRLCNLLKERYKKYLQNLQISLGMVTQDPTVEEEENVDQNKQNSWEDFEDPEIELTFGEILRCKRLAKLESAKRVGSRHAQGWQDTATEKPNMDVHEQVTDELNDSHDESGNMINTGRKLKKLSNSRGNVIHNRLCESTSIANAVELLKLLFLSNSADPEVQSSLAGKLQLYPKSDLISAFNYLKEKEFVVIGNESRGPVLSHKFWRSASSSPFPIDSGKRATSFLTWLQEQNKNLDDGVNLSMDIYCGEIFQICALVSSGELFISPCLPKEGVGEAEESKSSRSNMDDESTKLQSEEDKKNKSQGKMDSDLCSRREKGFPGIKVSAHRATVPRLDTLRCLSPDDQSNPSNADIETISSTLNSSDICEPPYDEMSKYAELLASSLVGRMESFTFCPEIFRSVCSVIDQAGEQGLNFEELSRMVGIQGVQFSEIMVDALEVFKVAFKVMAFDTVRVVTSTYQSKYFIGLHVDHNLENSVKTHLRHQGMSYKNTPQIMESDTGISDGHKLTVIELPQKSSQLQVETQLNKGSMVVVSEKKDESENKNVYYPILPWINCDGSNNTIIYKGLRRRVLGTVMQNPGILEEDIIGRMGVLNPQSCKKLLETMILDNHIIIKAMYQTSAANPPSILHSLFSSDITKPESVCRKHYFANPMSVDLL